MADELIAFPSKAEMLARSRQFWNPDKTQFWTDSGVPLVIDRREGYFIYDVSGKRLIDVHLNGGTYNLGHRNPEVTAAVSAAMQRFDIGNHHFPSLGRTALAEALISTAPPGLAKVVFGSGGGEAIDIALKTARHATQKRWPRPTTGTPAWPSRPATSGSRPCSWPTGRTSSPMSRSTTWPRWRTRCAAGTSRR
jgi:4-aminobutyrate aminotransferase-like enzyme